MGEQSVPQRSPQNRGQTENQQVNIAETGESSEEDTTAAPTNNGIEIEVPVLEFNSDEFPDEEDLTPEEFSRLDNQLDALFSALDDIEQKNDSIHAQLLQLLHANREIRAQLQQADGQDMPESPSQ